MKRRIISTLFILSGGACTLQAQQLMTLEECRRLTLQNSENIRIAAKQTEQAVAGKQAARTAYLPKVGASGAMAYVFKDIDMTSYLPTFVPDASGQLQPNLMLHPVTGEPVIGPDGNPVFNMYACYPLTVSIKGAYMAGITLEQPLYAGGKIIAGNKMAQTGVDIAGENSILQRMNAVVEADRAYWIYVAVNEKVKLLEKYAELLDVLTASVQSAYDVEMTGRNDLLKVQTRRGSVAYEMQRARNGQELARMSLCRVTGLDYATRILPTDSLVQIDGQPLPEPSGDVTLRPEYHILQQQVELETQQIKMTQADFLPTVGIGIGYQYLGGAKMSGQGMNFKLPFAMLSVNMPLFHFGEGAKKIKSARLQRDIRQLEFEKNSRLLELELKQTGKDLQDAYALVGVAESALEQAAENLRVSADNYEVGMEPIVNLLDAQAQWQQAYSNVIEARTNFKIKETEYLKTAGAIKTE